MKTTVLDDLSDILRILETDMSIDRIVFTGSGDTFASGADLKEIGSLDVASATEFGRRGQEFFRRLAGSGKMTVAAIDGFCMGGGLDLALSCNKRVASARAKLGHPGARLGIITGWGGTQKLPRLVGRKNAYRMFLTAEPVSASEAFSMGLVDVLDEDPVAFAMSVDNDWP